MKKLTSLLFVPLLTQPTCRVFEDHARNEWFQFSILLEKYGGVEFGPVNTGKNFRKCIFPEPGNFVVLIFQRPILFPFPGKKLCFFQHILTLSGYHNVAFNFFRRHNSLPKFKTKNLILSFLLIHIILILSNWSIFYSWKVADTFCTFKNLK